MKAWVETTRKYYKGSTVTFNPSADFQTYVVPANVTSVSVDCVASQGYDHNSTKKGGSGGRVQCTLATTPGTTLYIMVGSIPSDYKEVAYNASDIRTNNAGVVNTTSLNSRLIVAGGGGNAGNSLVYKYGGAGGGLTGSNGEDASSSNGGMGGTQSAGGTRYGALGTGGCGGVTQGTLGTGNNNMIAGGCGYYGGGGSYSSTRRAGGGGGSSYTDPTLCTNVVHTQGYKRGTGYVTISYEIEATEEDYDYYKDINKYSIIKEEESGQEDKYLAVKSFEKGQYYGN